MLYQLNNGDDKTMKFCSALAIRSTPTLISRRVVHLRRNSTHLRWPISQSPANLGGTPVVRQNR